MRYTSVLIALLTAAQLAAATHEVDSVKALNAAIKEAQEGDEIVIAKGEYQLNRWLPVKAPKLTIRGATGDRDDVVLIGGGMNKDGGVKEMFNLRASGITIRDLTIRDCYWNGIQVQGVPEVDDISIINVKSIDIGQRHIKASGHKKKGGHRPGRNLLIERVHMIQTKGKHGTDNDDYIGGMDLMMEEDVVVRDCVFENIRGRTGGGRGGIFMWQGIVNPTIERNVFIRCDRGIALGNPGTVKPELPTEGYHVRGGVVRNNTIIRGKYIALEFASVKDVLVANNTIYSEKADYFRTLHFIDAKGGKPVSGTRLVGNLIRGRVLDNTKAKGSGWEIVDGIHDPKGDVITADWFVDLKAGDLHLTEQATGAIDQGPVVEAVSVDMDNHPRPAEQRDIGADEFDSAAAE